MYSDKLARQYLQGSTYGKSSKNSQVARVGFAVKLIK
jgi:hypothetical protein